MKFFTNFFFLVLFSTTVLADGPGSTKPTALLPERVIEANTPTVINVIVQDVCHGSVVYYNTPGVTVGGMVTGSASSVSTAGDGYLTASALSMSSVGGGGVFGTSGQAFPVVTSCLRKGGKNE